jgi:hypothetical protein
MGGQLALVAELPNRPPVRIKRFSVLAGDIDDFDQSNLASPPRHDAASAFGEPSRRVIRLQEAQRK